MDVLVIAEQCYAEQRTFQFPSFSASERAAGTQDAGR